MKLKAIVSLYILFYDTHINENNVDVMQYVYNLYLMFWLGILGKGILLLKNYLVRNLLFYYYKL